MDVIRLPRLPVTVVSLIVVAVGAGTAALVIPMDPFYATWLWVFVGITLLWFVTVILAAYKASKTTRTKS